MRLTLRLFGLDVIDAEVTTDAPMLQPDGPGEATAMPMGFVARMDRPHEADVPDRDW